MLREYLPPNSVTSAAIECGSQERFLMGVNDSRLKQYLQITKFFQMAKRRSHGCPPLSERISATASQRVRVNPARGSTLPRVRLVNATAKAVLTAPNVSLFSVHLFGIPTLLSQLLLIRDFRQRQSGGPDVMLLSPCSRREAQIASIGGYGSVLLTLSGYVALTRGQCVARKSEGMARSMTERCRRHALSSSQPEGLRFSGVPGSAGRLT
jgi:hypothetical protein